MVGSFPLFDVAGYRCRGMFSVNVVISKHFQSGFSISELLAMLDLFGNMNPQLVGYRTMTRSLPHAQMLKESFLAERNPTDIRFFSIL